ncbi:MAG: urease accessory protein UreF [Rhodospirillaceae bacterium]
MTTTTAIIMATDTPMDNGSLYRLMTWLSPSFPVGAFTYSHGLEWAVEEGAIHDRESLTAWLTDLLELGGGWSDAVLFRNAYQSAAAGDWDAFDEAAELALALGPTRERRMETVQQGKAFILATRATWPWSVADAPRFDGDVAYPVAVAAVAAGHGVPPEPALHAYLHAFAGNLISAGVRAIPLGQTDGQRALAALEPVVAGVCERALAAGLDQVGGAAFLSDIASMKHETQYTRLFRS